MKPMTFCRTVAFTPDVHSDMKWITLFKQVLIYFRPLDQDGLSAVHCPIRMAYITNYLDTADPELTFRHSDTGDAAL